MKCQILFSWENKKNITNLSSAELAQRVVKVILSAVNYLKISICNLIRGQTKLERHK